MKKVKLFNHKCGFKIRRLVNDSTFYKIDWCDVCGIKTNFYISSKRRGSKKVKK